MTNFVVGLTGGIGSGKTTIANMFADLGIELIDADIIAREVVAPQSDALKQISEHFGSDFILANGHLNRAKLREKIFSANANAKNNDNNSAKTWLNNLLHPLIRQAILTGIKQANSPYCILVAPLLIENKLTTYVDRVLVIDVDEQTQIQRTCSRDNNNAEQVKNIINSQINRTQRLAAADDIIDNNNHYGISYDVNNEAAYEANNEKEKNTLTKLKANVDKLHQQYLQLSKQKHSTMQTNAKK